uniref:Perlwapin-like n=1 Tax=Sinocyclocheilus grahami TaxID=75366 RepID=A0A672QN94_SINGR
MTAGVCCSLIAALFCVSVCLSTRAEGAVNGSIHLAARLLPPKPGVRLKNNLEVAVSGVCAEMCSCDCPNNQKCCSNGCGRQCMAPYKEKPGVCPSKNLRIGVCAEICSHDSDCPNDEKCCSNGCGCQCMAPYREPEKPGVCPNNNLAVAFLVKCVELCSHDSDCPNDKCCSKGCGRQCKEKPGVCPSKNLGLGACVEMCSQDGDCPNDEKCCSNGCGHQCTAVSKAEPEKPGVCPKNNNNEGAGVCVDRCSHDRDCPNNQKCCSKGCLHQCMPPYRGFVILVCIFLYIYIY